MVNWPLNSKADPPLAPASNSGSLKDLAARRTAKVRHVLLNRAARPQDLRPVGGILTERVGRTTVSGREILGRDAHE